MWDFNKYGEGDLMSEQNNQASPPGQKNALGMDDRTTSWFAYIISIISAIIVLASVKDNKGVRIHAWQSLFLGCVYIALWIVLGLLGLIPYVGIFFWILIYLMNIGYVVLSVFCILKALKDDILKLPVIYPQAEKMN